MKKCFVISIAIFIFVLSSGCDMHSGKRPRDYPPAKWVSEEPEMWCEGVYKIYGFDGCLILDGQIIEINVFFDYGSGVYFSETGGTDTFTRGRCTFRPDKLVVKIDKERDNLRNGICETITFIRN
jgi:hypothetical protein